VSASRSSISLRRTVALVLIPLVATGCHSWRTAAVAPRAVIESEHPYVVRVTTQDSARQVLRGPRIVADTLRGARGNDSVAVALRDVTRMDVERFSAGKTAALVVVLGLIVYGVLSAARNFTTAN